MSRNFLNAMPIVTKDLVVVGAGIYGMRPYIVDIPIGQAYVNIAEHEYFVKIEFFLVGYLGYEAAASYLGLPVISHYRYDEYVELLFPQMAMAGALTDAITDELLELIESTADQLEEIYPDALDDVLDDDLITKEVLSLKKEFILSGTSDDAMWDAAEYVSDLNYTVIRHAALRLIVSTHSL